MAPMIDECHREGRAPTWFDDDQIYRDYEVQNASVVTTSQIETLLLASAGRTVLGLDAVAMAPFKNRVLMMSSNLLHRMRVNSPQSF